MHKVVTSDELASIISGKKIRVSSSIRTIHKGQKRKNLTLQLDLLPRLWSMDTL